MRGLEATGVGTTSFSGASARKGGLATAIEAGVPEVSLWMQSGHSQSKSVYGQLARTSHSAAPPSCMTRGLLSGSDHGPSTRLTASALDDLPRVLLRYAQKSLKPSPHESHGTTTTFSAGVVQTL